MTIDAWLCLDALRLRHSIGGWSRNERCLEWRRGARNGLRELLGMGMLRLRRRWARGIGRHGSCGRKDLVLGWRSGLLRGSRIPRELGNTKRREFFLPALHYLLAEIEQTEGR